MVGLDKPLAPNLGFKLLGAQNKRFAPCCNVRLKLAWWG